MEAVKKMQDDIGDADLPKLFRIRESDLSSFTSCLSEAESNFQDLKRVLSQKPSGSDLKELQADVRTMDEKLQVFREERAGFKRLLFGDLAYSIVEHPEQMKALPIMADCVQKIVDMGIAMGKGKEILKSIGADAEKLRWKVSG